MKFLKSTGLALALAIGLQGCAATVDTAPVAPAPATLGQGPALWKVADEDTTIYLFGTVHALPADVDWYSGPVKTALDSAGSLVTEIDMTPESLAAMGPIIQSKGTLPADQTLRALMNDDQRSVFEAGMTRLGLPVAALDRLEPWLAAISLTQIQMQKAGYGAESGVEAVLESTIGDDATRGALETVEYQISVFDELPFEAQIPFLLQTIEDPAEGIALLERIVGEWQVGDVEEVGALINEAFQTDPVLAARLLYDRNANWAVWIDDRLDAPGVVFMAVGAGHLAGEKSVQDYLKQRGIAVIRVQ